MPGTKPPTKFTDKKQILLTLAQLVRETGIAREALKRNLDKADILPDDDGYYSARHALPYLIKPEKEYSDPFSEKAAAQAQQEWMKVGEMQQLLIADNRYRENLYLIIAPIVDFLNSIPNIVERQVQGFPRDAKVALERLTDGARDNFTAEVQAVIDEQRESRKRATD